MRSGDHNGAIEIHWLVYTFPWRQPESTRGACPFDVALSRMAGRNFEEILQHLKKKKSSKTIF